MNNLKASIADLGVEFFSSISFSLLFCFTYVKLNVENTVYNYYTDKVNIVYLKKKKKFKKTTSPVVERIVIIRDKFC